MLKDNFNFSRFMTLVRLEYKQNFRSNSLRLLTFLTIMTGLYLFVTYINRSDYLTDYWREGSFPDSLIPDPLHPILLGITLVIGLLFGAESGSRLFEQMSTRQGRITMLTLPATQFEKFLLRWLTSVPLYVVSFIVVTYLADWIRYLLLKTIYPDSPYIRTLNILGEYFNLQLQEVPQWMTMLLVVVIFTSLQSFFLLGSAFFRKYAAIKTVGVCVAVTVSYVCFAIFCSKLILPSESWYDPEGVSQFSAILLFDILLLLFSIGMWILTYYRFKESEVIERL